MRGRLTPRKHASKKHRKKSPAFNHLSILFEFDISYITQGFVNHTPNTKIIRNGTFFNNYDYFPHARCLALEYGKLERTVNDEIKKTKSAEEVKSAAKFALVPKKPGWCKISFMESPFSYRINQVEVYHVLVSCR